MIPVKQKFSHLGFAITFYLIVSNLLSIVAGSAYIFVVIFLKMMNLAAAGGPGSLPMDPQYYMKIALSNANSFGYLLAAQLPAYLIAVPLTLLFLNSRKFRDIPTSSFSFSSDYEKSQKKDLTVSEFVTFFIITLSFGTIGSLISASLNAIYSMATGKDMSNLLNSLLSNLPLHGVFVFTVILAPIFEEILYRYGVVGYCRRYGEWNAIILGGVIFGLIHTNLFQFFYAFMLGCMFAYIYIYTRQLKYTIALHMLFNLLGAFVPMLLSQDGSMTIGVTIYYACYYSLAVVGVVLLIMYIKKGRLSLPMHDTPVPGYGSRDVYLNPGMICMILLCIIISIYMQFFSTGTL